MSTGTCFSLATSMACPDLSTAFVMSDTQDGITDVTGFDNFVMTKAKETSPEYIAGFQSTYGCKMFAGMGIRFYQSTVCHFLVSTSLNYCKAYQTTTYTPLCQSTCLNYISSVQAIFNNTAICTATPTDAQAAARQAFLTPGSTPGNSDIYYAWCLTLNPATQAPQCVNGLKSEASTMGFATLTEAVGFCKAGTANMTTSDAQTCATVLDTFASAVVELLKPAVNLPWIATGLAAAGMIFIYLFFVVSISLRRWRNSSNKRVAIFSAPPKEKEEKAAPPPPAKGAPAEFVGASGPGFTGTIARGGELPQAKRQSIFERMGGAGRRNDDPFRNERPMSSSTRFSRAQADMGSRSNAPPGDYLPMNDDSNLLVKMSVVEAYAAQLADEATLRMGDTVIVEEMFDDGWCTIRNEMSGEVGVVPLSCLAPADGGRRKGSRKSGVRASSLYTTNP
ncbi:hypothetical protein DFJ73DRAFT_176419 [Zopfochytrium polystomum]|nr:hypothetical protein DFJ73DRAFT_176419 [Zopfochytrium polystomum]